MSLELYILKRYLTYLDSFDIEFEPFFLVDQEFFDIFSLITLKLDHFAHLSIVDNGAIASLINFSQPNSFSFDTP